MQRKKHTSTQRRDLFQFTAPRVLLLAVLLLGLLGLLGGVAARYLHQARGEENCAAAKDFYFTIDLIQSSGAASDVTGFGTTESAALDLYGGGTQNLVFSVQNYFDNLRITQEEICYTVSAQVTKGQGEVRVSGEKENTLSGATSQEDGSVTWEKAVKEHTLTVDSGYSEGDEVTITVISSAPYVKTMTLTVTLHTGAPEVLYRVEDSADSPCATLVVLSQVALPENSISVSWPAELQPDSTSPYLSTGTLSSPTKIASQIGAGESIVVRFFKADPTKVYSVNDTALTKNSDGSYTIALAEGSKEVAK